MRLAGLIPALLLSTAAFAAELPISGTYGTAGACALYALAGEEGVVTNGGSTAIPEGMVRGLNIAEDDAMILLRPDRLLGYEWGCEAADAKIDGESATFSCAESEEPFTLRATIREDKQAGTVLFTDKAGSVTLRRCPAAPVS